MREKVGPPQMPPGKTYRTLFGLEIYLTPVFMISSIAIVTFVIGTLVFQEDTTRVFTNTRVWLTTNLDWLFLISVNLVLLFCVFVACSPLGKVRFCWSHPWLFSVRPVTFSVVCLRARVNM